MYDPPLPLIVTRCPLLVKKEEIQFVHTVSVCQLDQFHAGLGQSYLAVSVAAKNTLAVHIEIKYMPSVKR